MNVEDAFRICYRNASKSPDRSNQNGAILVDTDTDCVVGSSCNHFKRIQPVLEDRDEKLARITHAEEGTVMSAWGSTGPLVMFCPWASCAPCARDIINCPADIKELTVHLEKMNLIPHRWIKMHEYGHAMLREAGITIHVYSGRIPDARTIICNGRKWSPDSLKFLEKE